MENTKKKTGGRKKIPIQKIHNKSNRAVTFTKRRKGLFKMAGELAQICGAEIGILVQSPGDKVFAFGNPSVESVLSRFQGGSSSMDFVQNQNAVEMERRLYMEAVGKLEKERENERKLIENGRRRNGFWFVEPLESSVEDDVEQLEQYWEDIEALRSNVLQRIAKMKNMTLHSSEMGTNMAPEINCDSDAIPISGEIYIVDATPHSSEMGNNMAPEINCDSDAIPISEISGEIYIVDATPHSSEMGNNAAPEINCDGDAIPIYEISGEIYMVDATPTPALAETTPYSSGMGKNAPPEINCDSETTISENSGEIHIVDATPTPETGNNVEISGSGASPNFEIPGEIHVEDYGFFGDNVDDFADWELVDVDELRAFLDDL